MLTSTSQLGASEFKLALTYLNTNFDHINRSLKLDPDISQYVEDARPSLLLLSANLRTCLNTLKNMHKNNKRKLSELSCELKRKKLKEKRDVLSKLSANPLKPAMAITLSTAQFQPPETANLTLNGDKVNLKCYVCKKTGLTRRHSFYDQLCFECATFNYAKRAQTCDLAEKYALVTGCRVKIGHEICLFLLRSKCHVIGTTRFPKDAFRRFASEPDFGDFKHLLTIYPLDLRQLNEVNKLIRHLDTSLPKLDILINNAAQTVRRSVKFYEHLLDAEAMPLDESQNNAIHSILPQARVMQTLTHIFQFGLIVLALPRFHTKSMIHTC